MSVASASLAPAVQRGKVNCGGDTKNRASESEFLRNLGSNSRSAFKLSRIVRADVADKDGTLVHATFA